MANSWADIDLFLVELEVCSFWTYFILFSLCFCHFCICFCRIVGVSNWSQLITTMQDLSMLCSRAASVCRDSDDDGAEHLTVRKLRAVLAVANSTLQVAKFSKSAQNLTQLAISLEVLFGAIVIPKWILRKVLDYAQLCWISFAALPFHCHGTCSQAFLGATGLHLLEEDLVPCKVRHWHIGDHRSMTCFGFPHFLHFLTSVNSV